MQATAGRPAIVRTSGTRGMPAIAAMSPTAVMHTTAVTCSAAVIHAAAVTLSTSNCKNDVHSMTATTAEMQAKEAMKATPGLPTQ
jgi:hypothetical protein